MLLNVAVSCGVKRTCGFLLSSHTCDFSVPKTSGAGRKERPSHELTVGIINNNFSHHAAIASRLRQHDIGICKSAEAPHVDSHARLTDDRHSRS